MPREEPRKERKRPVWRHRNGLETDRFAAWASNVQQRMVGNLQEASLTPLGANSICRDQRRGPAKGPPLTFRLVSR